MHVVKAELEEGISLSKCRQCGCMKEMLEAVGASLASMNSPAAAELSQKARGWLAQMEPIKYACLGCAHCYPAVATNALNLAFPEATLAEPGCAFEARVGVWPPVPGEYFASCTGAGCPVAVSTLASVELAGQLASMKPKGLCIVGKTETENIGVDKLIKNTISNPTLRFLVVAGREPEGHFSGRTLLALAENGVDERMRVVASPGKRPVLRNVTREEVEAFRRQVQAVEMVGCEAPEVIAAKVNELSQVPAPARSCQERATQGRAVQLQGAPVVEARQPDKVEMDRAGYFVIIPQSDRGIIAVEHYSYDNTLLRTIEGKDARSVYWTVVSNGWVTQLSHAAYLGKELARAELSIRLSFPYVQDGA